MLPRDSAECQLAALVLVLSVVPAMCTAIPGLQLEARSTNTISQQECFPVQEDPYHHSSRIPSLNDQTPEYTIWQQFCIKNSTANFTVTFNPPKWSRQPYNLSYSKGRYHYNKTLHPYVTEDRRLCVNASITMYDLMGEIDSGSYKIIVSTDCSSDDMFFHLTIDQCGIGDVPRPIQPTQKPLIVPEGNGQSALSWKYMFYGDNQLTDYIFRITKFGEIVCDECNPGSHFDCTRETLDPCNITITAHIQNYTHNDSGEYCAAAYSTGAQSTGNDSCLKLVVVQQPVVDQFPGKSQLGLGGASLVYHISNFSEYVNIQFVKDGKKSIDRSGNGYKLELQYNPLDNTTVTLTLHMTGNLKHAGDYTLCTSLVNDTSTRNCTTSVSVSKVRWIGEVAGCIIGALLLGIIITVTLCCCWRCKKKQVSGDGSDVQRDSASNGTSGRNRHGYSRVPEESAEDGPKHGQNSSTGKASRFSTPQDAELDSPLPCQDPVWQRIPDASLDLRLDECQLQKTSELFTDWKPLARYLGLKEHTIAEIDEDNRTSKERKYQVLYTWSQFNIKVTMLL